MKELVTFWKSSMSGFGSRNFLRIFQHCKITLFHTLAYISGKTDKMFVKNFSIDVYSKDVLDSNFNLPWQSVHRFWWASHSHKLLLCNPLSCEHITHTVAKCSYIATVALIRCWHWRGYPSFPYPYFLSPSLPLPFPFLFPSHFASRLPSARAKKASASWLGPGKCLIFQFPNWSGQRGQLVRSFDL